MYQNLVHGIRDSKLNASYKNGPYKTRFKMTHMGIDLVSSMKRNEIYGNGDGKVLRVGYDTTLGNFTVILYMNCYNHKTKKVADLVIRQWHLAKIYVTANQTITKNTMVGLYGNTGKYTTGPHLHLEVDTDTRLIMWTPTLTWNSSHFVGTNPNSKGVPTKANDSTMSNPLEWLCLLTDGDRPQTWTTAADEYINTEDLSAFSITTSGLIVP